MKSHDPDRDAPTQPRYARPFASALSVLRPQVLDRLSSPNTRVAAVMAPGGYGKTSHLASWAVVESRPTAWIDLESSLNDPHSLLGALTEALSLVTDLPSGTPSAGGVTPSQVTTVVAPAFGQAIAQCRTPFVLVLDDVHLITEEPALDLIDSFVARVPVGSTVVLAGRAVHFRSFAWLRAEGRLTEIAASDLALGSPEAKAVLENMGVELDDGQVDRLVAATEGWPVGIRLGALALTAKHDGEEVVRALQGREPLVSDYLRNEWLRGMGDTQREFLLRSSVLDRLSGAACNHLLDRSDSGELLHRIYSDRLLVIPLDRRQESYRTHPLLRDALLAEFEQTDAAGVRLAHQRAGDWNETAGNIDSAIHHRLAAGDLDAAERLIVEHAPRMYTNGHFATLRRWLSSLPDDRIEQNPSLCVMAAMTSLGLGDGEATASWIRFADGVLANRPAGTEDERTRTQVRLLRSIINTGAVTPALEDARAAYERLPPGTWHSIACLISGVWAWLSGEDGSERTLAEGAGEAAVCRAPSTEASCRALLAVLAYTAGDHDAADSLAREARRLLDVHGLEHAPSLVNVVATSSFAAARAGDIERARAELNLARSNLGHYHQIAGWAHVISRLMLIQTSLLLDDRAGARTLTNELERCLRAQPDARRAHEHLAAVEVRLERSRAHETLGPTSLTTAELGVLHYLPTNLNLAEIAGRLFISRFTVKTHCTSIYRKLGVQSRGAAVDVARELGLLRDSARSPAG